jgi:hypothetical protein
LEQSVAPPPPLPLLPPPAPPTPAELPPLLLPPAVEPAEFPLPPAGVPPTLLLVPAVLVPVPAILVPVPAVYVPVPAILAPVPDVPEPPEPPIGGPAASSAHAAAPKTSATAKSGALRTDDRLKRERFDIERFSKQLGARSRREQRRARALAHGLLLATTTRMSARPQLRHSLCSQSDSLHIRNLLLREKFVLELYDMCVNRTSIAA